MPLDLRKPIAALFVILGSLLTGYGVAIPGAHGDIAPDFNVNLTWGIAMILFAALLMALSRKS
jgi:uncharacterized membrane protein YdcZ (DUF606 family)